MERNARKCVSGRWGSILSASRNGPDLKPYEYLDVSLTVNDVLLPSWCSGRASERSLWCSGLPQSVGGSPAGGRSIGQAGPACPSLRGGIVARVASRRLVKDRNLHGQPIEWLVPVRQHPHLSASSRPR